MEEASPASNSSETNAILQASPLNDATRSPPNPSPGTSPRLETVFNRYLKPYLIMPYDVIWHEKSDRYIVTDKKGSHIVAIHPCNGASQTLCSKMDGLKGKGIMQPWGIAAFQPEDSSSDMNFLFTDNSPNREILQFKDQKCTPWGTDELHNRMESPSGIAISPKGDVYVTDYVKGQVHWAKHDGSYVSSFGGCYLQKPRSIALNSMGHIHVVDETSHVHIFKENGELLKSFQVNAEDWRWACRAVAVDKYDNVVVTAREIWYVYPFSNETVLFYDANGEPLDQVVGDWFEFNCARGLCFDYKRNRMVVVNGKGRCLNVYKLYAE